MKRARVKEAALAVLIREGFDAKTADRLAELIAHEPIPAKPGQLAVSTANTGATARPISSSSSMRRNPGARSRSPVDGR